MKFEVNVKKENEFAFDFPELGCEVEIEHDESLPVNIRASAALCEALNSIRRSRKQIPLPDNHDGCKIPLVLELKIKLWNYMCKNRYRGVDLAKKLQMSEQKVARILNFAYPSDLSRVVEACESLGLEVIIDVRENFLKRKKLGRLPS